MRSLLIAAILCLFFPPLALCASQAEKETAALKAAEHFLVLVDQGKFGESWDAASSLFTSRVSREEWQRAIAGVRPPLGKLIQRSVKSRQFMTSAPGVPDGAYVMILFAASFEHKQQAIETVTTTLDKDGTWRVAGYFIK